MTWRLMLWALLLGLTSAGPRRGCDGLWRKIDRCRGSDITIEKIMTRFEVPAVRTSMSRCIAIMTAHRNQTDRDDFVCTHRGMYIEAADCVLDVVDEVRGIVTQLEDGDKHRLESFRACALRVTPGARYY